MFNYPDDFDGEMLSHIRDSGSEMDQPMVIDFAIDAHPKKTAEAVATACEDALKEKGYQVEIVAPDDSDPEDNRWSVYCSIHMIPVYDEIVQIQKDLQAIAEPVGGAADGWGTFGNAPENS